jgi:triosephosphate isomerase (TIM)
MAEPLRTLIINFKNYPEASGEAALKLAESAAKVSLSTPAEIIVAPPTPMLGLVARSATIPVFAQSVFPAAGVRTTGAITAEAVKYAGAAGTLLNHSEARVPRAQVEELSKRLKGLGLRVCLCTRTPREAGILARLGSEYLAVEPPELIGSGVAVSRVRPGVITETVSAARGAGYRGKLLCGAGIMGGADVSKAVELGADGILVSSGVVKAKQWESKIRELADPLL